MPKKRADSERVGISASNFILNCLPSRDTHNDWPIASAEAAGFLLPGDAPPSKDLRELWWEIGHQGRTGSCVGWASADSVLRWHFVKANRLLQNELLSVRFAWMAAKETDEFVDSPTSFLELDGTSLKAALEIARKYGTVLDSILPFKLGELYRQSRSTFYALASQRRIASYFNLGADLSEWRMWIATNGPILARLEVDATWENAKSSRGKLDTYQPDTFLGGHAVALVGYTPDRFIVRNSWGTDWGDDGFASASDLYVGAAITEAYGVML